MLIKKIHPDIAGAHAFIIGDTTYVPIGSVLVSIVSTHNWEVIDSSRTRLAEWLQTQLNIKEIEDNHKNLLDLIEFFLGMCSNLRTTSFRLLLILLTNV